MDGKTRLEAEFGRISNGIEKKSTEKEKNKWDDKSEEKMQTHRSRWYRRI